MNSSHWKTKAALYAVLGLAAGGIALSACGDGEGMMQPPPGPMVPSVSVSPSAPATLESVGETVQLSASAQDADGNTVSATFTWSSSDDAIATVDNNGLVTAAGNGTATITATADGVSGSVDVTTDQVTTQMAFGVQPSNGSVDEPLAPAATVELQDANGNVATNNADQVTIAIGTNPNSGTLAGTFATDAVAGVAAFSNLLIDAAGQGYTLDATSGTLLVESDAFNLTLPSVYVVNSTDANVSVVSTQNNSQITTVPVGAFPRNVALTPDGAFAYVTNEEDSTVTVIETATNTVVTTVAGLDGPIGVVASLNGDFVYVTNFDAGSVAVIETAGNTVSLTINISANSGALDAALSPDGTSLYVTHFDDNTVSVISTQSNTVTATVTVGTEPRDLAVTPDGAFVYVTDSADDAVSVINAATNTVVATIPGVGTSPYDIAITPDGAFAYVTDIGGNEVVVIETATNTIATTLDLGATHAGIAISADGSIAYVLHSEDGLLSVIDTGTNTETTTVAIEAGSRLRGVALMPPPLP